MNIGDVKHSLGIKQESALNTGKRDMSETEAYNFIEINKDIFKAYSSYEELPHYMDINAELLSGQIDYEINVNTALITNMIRTSTGISIPASTVRGNIRANLQILGFTALDRDIEDQRFRYRLFSGSSLAKVYAHKAGAVCQQKNKIRTKKLYTNIHAGIMKCEDGEYYIQKCDSFFMNKENKCNDFEPYNGYYAIDLQNICNIEGWKTKFQVRYKNYANIFSSLSDGMYSSRKAGASKSKTIRTPFMLPVLFATDYSRALISVKNYDSALKEAYLDKNIHEGYLLSSGFMPGNRKMYLIPRAGINNEKYSIRECVIKDYIRNINSYCNIRDEQQYYHLPQNGEEKPVFYIRNAEEIQFGFTLLFPFFYKNSVKEGIRQNKLSEGYDYDEAIFGFKKKEKTYAGRVSFENAHLLDGNVQKNTVPVMYAPKAQCALNYLEENTGLAYEDPNFTLRGLKQYWLHRDVYQRSLEEDPAKSSRMDMARAGSVFLGKIRFYNLRPDELGLLLWSVELNQNSEQNWGYAKPLGYGRIKLKIRNAYLYQQDNFIMHAEAFSDTRREIQPIEYIQKYITVLEDFLGKPVKNCSRLRDFFLMKDILAMPDGKKLKYDNFVRSRRREKLAYVYEIAKNVDWLLLTKSEMNDLKHEIEWDTFLSEAESLTKALHPEHEIYQCYIEVVQKTELFEKEKYFFLKSELLEDLSNKIAEIQKLKSAYFNRTSISYDAVGQSPDISESIKKCLRLAGDLLSDISRKRQKLNQEYLPQLIVNARFTEDCHGIILEVNNAKYNRPALLEDVKVEKSGICYDTDLKEMRYVYDSLTATIHCPVKLSVEEKNQAFLECSIIICYSYMQEKERKRVCITDRKMIVIKEAFHKADNPYSNYARGAEVDNDEMFFGREAIVKDVVSMIRQSSEIDTGRNVIIYGQKRSGKSSIMYHVKKELEKLHSRLIIIPVGNLGSSMVSDSGFESFILESIENTLERKYPEILDMLDEAGIEIPIDEVLDTSNTGHQHLFFRFFDRFTALISEHYRIVLLIDEFTYIYGWMQDGLYSSAFMKKWKAFIQNYKICALLIGQDFMPDFINEYQNEFGAAKSFHINYLEEKAAKDLIAVPYRKINQREGFDQKSIDYIYELTAGSAYYIMIICDSLVRYMNHVEINVVNKNVLDTFFHDIILNVESKERWDKEIFDPLLSDGGYTQWEKDNLIILHEMACSADGEGWCKTAAIIDQLSNMLDVQGKIDRMEARDVIVVKQRAWAKIKIPLFKEWLIFKYGGKYED